MKKRIILITNAFPFGKGEASFIVPELNVASKKYDISIISRNNIDEQTTELDSQVEIYRYSSHISIKEVLKSTIALCRIHVLNTCIKSIFSPRNIIKTIKFVVRAHHFADYVKQIQNKYDQPIVYYTYWNDYATYALTNMTHLKKEDRIISRIHGGDLYLRPTNDYFLPLKKEMIQGLDRLFFISEDGRRYFISTYKVSSTNKFVVCRMGTNNTYGMGSGSRDDVLRLLSLSNITFGKRVERIAEALAQIEDVNVEWTHIGDGEEDEKVHTLTHQFLDGKDNIRYQFTGRMRNIEVQRYLATKPVDLLINVSYSEGLPVSMMEAASFGIPIVGTNVGGVSEIIGKDNGYLLNRDFTTDELKKILIQFAHLNYEERDLLRWASRKKWEEAFAAAENYARFVAEVDSLWENEKEGF